jgi:hypothetical protein
MNARECPYPNDNGRFMGMDVLIMYTVGLSPATVMIVAGDTGEVAGEGSDRWPQRSGFDHLSVVRP